MDFQPLPKGGDARLWASSLYRPSTEGAGGCATAILLRKRRIALNRSGLDRRYAIGTVVGARKSSAIVKCSLVFGHMSKEVRSRSRRLHALLFGRVRP